MAKRRERIVFRVVEHEEVRVFQCGDFSLDALDATGLTYARPGLAEGEATPFEVWRNGVRLDVGKIEYIGTHAPEYLFTGLCNLGIEYCINLPNVIGHRLLPDWFQLEDELRLLGTQSSLNEHLSRTQPQS